MRRAILIAPVRCAWMRGRTCARLDERLLTDEPAGIEPVCHVMTVDGAAGLLEQHLANQDAPCPKCGYNLRGLRGRSTCPECGVSLCLEVAGTRRSPGPVWVPLLALAIGATWPALQVTFLVMMYRQAGQPLSSWLFFPGGLACVALAGFVRGCLRRRRDPNTAWRWAAAALACNGVLFTGMLILPRLGF